MNKICYYLIFLVLLFSLPGYTQTLVWEENFNVPPQGWTLEGNWAFQGGNMSMYYFPVVINYDFSAISPEIVIPENAGELTISQYLDVFQYSVTTEVCAISILFDGGETILWIWDLASGNWGVSGGEEISFSLADFSGQTIQVRIRSWGPTTDAWWGCYVYSMKISAFIENELCAQEVTGPNNIIPGVTGTWDVVVKNVGMQPQSGFEVKLFSYKTGEEFGSLICEDTLYSGETTSIGFDWTFGSPHNTCLYGVVILAGDEFPANNKTKGHFLRVEPEIEYQVLLWDFDNGIETIQNPETGQLEQPDVSLKKALDDAGITYNPVFNLPASIDEYDIIVITMGCYCLI
nr:hypothetical protein [Bacteroidota bacterium]